jgi:hypothetical protein
MFTKGQKVVCIDDKFPAAAAQFLFDYFPRKGSVYTVRGVYIGRRNYNNLGSASSEAEVGLLLNELRNRRDPRLLAGLDGELGFNAERFTPLEELPPAKSSKPKKKPANEPDEDETWEEYEARKYGNRETLVPAGFEDDYKEAA